MSAMRVGGGRNSAVAASTSAATSASAPRRQNPHRSSLPPPPPPPQLVPFTHRCGIHVRWYRPWIYGVGAVAATSYAVARRCRRSALHLLDQEYTQDGLVVFQDVCTKEVASAPIGKRKPSCRCRNSRRPRSSKLANASRKNESPASAGVLFCRLRAFPGKTCPGLDPGGHRASRPQSVDALIYVIGTRSRPKGCFEARKLAPRVVRNEEEQPRQQRTGAERLRPINSFAPFPKEGNRGRERALSRTESDPGADRGERSDADQAAR